MILRIECPKCRQSFEVGEELKGRTVECGSCENRFQVTDEVTVPNRERFYPDESRKSADLSRFGRAPAAGGSGESPQMDYAASAKKDFIGPVPPIRNFAAAGGVVLMLVCALAFYFGSLPNGSLLKDVDKMDRYTIAGFFGIVGFLLLVWGMLRARVVAVLVGLLSAGGLVALAHYLPVYKTPVYVSGADGEDGAEPREEEPAKPFFPGITDETPLTPTEVADLTRWKATVVPMIVEFDESRVAAVWIRNMQEYQGREIGKFIQQELNLPDPPYFRELSGKVTPGGIFVMSGIPMDLDQVEAVAERLGEVEQVLPDLRVVQMRLNVKILGGEISSELNNKLIDPTNGAFFPLNYKELLALDQGRVKDAVKRLSNVEGPLQMRKDITVRLIGLLNQDNETEMVSLLGNALAVWSEEGDGADQVVVTQVVKMVAAGKPIPDELIRLLAERKTPTAANILVELWAIDPTGRQRFLATYGEGIAPLMESYLTSSNQALARSAVRVLGLVGTKDQLPEMRKALASSQDEALKVSLAQSIKQVERR